MISTYYLRQRLARGVAVLALMALAATGAALGARSDHRAELAQPKPWRQCAAGTVPVLGKTLSGTVCVPGQLVAGDAVQ